MAENMQRTAKDLKYGRIFFKRFAEINRAFLVNT